jgi:hypothetical protein
MGVKVGINGFGMYQVHSIYPLTRRSPHTLTIYCLANHYLQDELDVSF